MAIRLGNYSWTKRSVTTRAQTPLSSVPRDSHRGSTDSNGLQCVQRRTNGMPRPRCSRLECVACAMLTYEALAGKGEAMTTAEMVTYACDQIDQARTELKVAAK